MKHIKLINLVHSLPRQLFPVVIQLVLSHNVLVQSAVMSLSYSPLTETGVRPPVPAFHFALSSKLQRHSYGPFLLKQKEIHFSLQGEKQRNNERVSTYVMLCTLQTPYLKCFILTTSHFKASGSKQTEWYSVQVFTVK